MKGTLNLYTAVGEFLDAPTRSSDAVEALARVIEAYDAMSVGKRGLDGPNDAAIGASFDPRESGSYDPVDDGFAYPVEDTHDIGGEG